MSRPLRVEFSGAVYHMTLSEIATRFNLKISGLNTLMGIGVTPIFYIIARLFSMFHPGVVRVIE